MNISEIISQLQAIFAVQGDVPGEVKIQFLGSHACGSIIDIKCKSLGGGKPFVQIVGREKE